MNLRFNVLTVIFCLLTVIINGQDTWNGDQKQLLKTMNLFSETTAPNGIGADAYGIFLSNDFSRWTIGSSITNNKKKWVEGVREWFDDGWRVSERKQQNLEILIMDNIAHTRRIVTETYLGPKGDTSKSKAALAEIWVKENSKWLLFRVNVHPMAND